jgi:hypothetical protein
VDNEQLKGHEGIRTGKLLLQLLLDKLFAEHFATTTPKNHEEMLQHQSVKSYLAQTEEEGIPPDFCTHTPRAKIANFSSHFSMHELPTAQHSTAQLVVLFAFGLHPSFLPSFLPSFVRYCLLYFCGQESSSPRMFQRRNLLSANCSPRIISCHSLTS